MLEYVPVVPLQDVFVRRCAPQFAFVFGLLSSSEPPITAEDLGLLLASMLLAHQRHTAVPLHDSLLELTTAAGFTQDWRASILAACDDVRLLSFSACEFACFLSVGV